MSDYTVERIDRLAAFELLRASWERLHAIDPHAHVFTSWGWQRAYWEISPYRPFVAAVRDRRSDAYVAFAPLASERWPARLPFGAALHLGGSPKADYTGLVADPAHENAAAEVLAEYLDGLTWDHAFLDDTRDPRIALIVERLRARGNRIVTSRSTTCPYVVLGKDFEGYLAGLSKGFRANLRRSLRTFEQLGATLEVADDTNIDERIEMLVTLNYLRWRGNLAHARVRFGTLFRNAYDRGCLQIFSLRRGGETIATQAVFLCEREGAYLMYMTGSDPEYAKYSPGIALNALAIEHAIARGYKLYDFTRGNEAYKARFGTQTRETRNVLLARRGLRAAAVHATRGWQAALRGRALKTLAAVSHLRPHSIRERRA